jgi:ComF family protein
MNKLKETILDIFLPKCCVGCRKEGQYICSNCELFLNEVSNTDKALFALWKYEGIIEKAIQKVKNEGAFNIIDELTEKALSKMELNLPADLYITYIPLSGRREKRIGFNWAELIARKIGEMTGRKRVKLLERVKDNSSQSGLNLKERRENVKNAFSLSESFNPEFSNVLLVDDFCTSYATIEEGKRVLKNGGVKNVWGFALAKSDH